MLLTIISIGHLCVFLYCIVCFNVLIQLLAATVNKWCYYYKLTDRSFTHHAPVLWNSLLKHLRQPSPHCSLPSTTYPIPLLALSSLQFHSQLKTFLFLQSFPPWHLPLSVLWPPDSAHVFISLSFHCCWSRSSFRTWVLFINNVRKFVVCASIELECCGGRLQRLLARINSTERRSCVAILHISECSRVYGQSYVMVIAAPSGVLEVIRAERQN